MARGKRKTKSKQKPSKTARRGSSPRITASQTPQQFNAALDYVKHNQLKTGLIGALVIIVLLLAFPLRFLVIAATVNGQPIYSWQYLNQLNKSAGSQVINQLVSEKLIEQEIAKQGVQVTQAEVDAQIAQIESQFGEESGGLGAVLSAQGLTREQFEKQIRLNLGLEKLVKGTIEISPEDVQKELSDNAELYAELSELDAATTAAENLRSDRMQEEFQTWFQQIREQANLKINIPLPTPPELGL